MTQTGLEAIARTEGDATVLELHGEIDGSARDALRAAYDAGRADGPMILDFAAVGYINSTGIALIVGLLARARAEARAVSARGLSAHYREIFEITRLSDFMTIIDPGASA
jgi:anti-sigma B factor antagonist